MTEGIDSALPAVAGVAPMEGDRALPLATVPPLTWMALVGCLGDLLIQRVLLRTWADALSRDAFQQLERWGAFARNLGVVSALVALGFCLFAYGSKRSGLPLSARVGVMGFGWALIPIVALMTFLPLAWTRVELVLVVVGLAHALILLLILAGIHWRSTVAISTALALLLVSFLSSFLSLMVSLVGARALWEHGERLAFAFRWSGELGYLAIPLALAFAVRIPLRSARGKWTLAAAALAATLVALGLAGWHAAAKGKLADLFYGAFGLDLFIEHGAVGWYAAPLAIGSAVGVAAMLSPGAKSRQVGAGLFLLLCTGYAPRTPTALIMSVLAVALVSRAALTQAWERRDR